MRKYEIALMLARRYGYTSYLEICTPNTGFTFSKVDRNQFLRRKRLMYRCPTDFSDGEPVDFSTRAESGEELFSELMKFDERFSLVFVDAWHTYESSLRDIVFGLQLIEDNGVLLIHDCNPPNSTCAEPEYRPGEWCGVTYAAYLDVVLYTGDFHYTTVDSDYGCGIISKDRNLTQPDDCSLAAGLASRWRTLDLPQKYPFFDENRSQLLRLISTDEFCHRLGEARPVGTRRLWQLMRRSFSGD